MIVTEGPTLEEKLIKVTPWWDVVSKYLIAAMMAIALTSIVVQVTKDNVICVPAVDCSRSTLANGSLAVNVSGDSAKLCQSLTPKSSKKKVLAKMVDRRLYDYVDSVCFQELSWFTKFFPLFLLGEAVLLLVIDILWTKLPYSSSVLNHFLDLAAECYSSSATIDIILGKIKVDSSGSSYRPPIPEADALNVLSLVEKAEDFRETYAGENMKHVSRDAENDPRDVELEEITDESTKQLNKSENDKNDKEFLFKFYKRLTFFQISICFLSFAFDLSDAKTFFSAFGKTFQFECHIDEFVFTQEYDHFECSHPLAPYFQIAVILFLVFLCVHFVISFIALCKVWKGNSYTFPKESDEESKTITNNDFAFLFFLLTKHDKVYADRVSYFFKPGENIQGNILSFINKS